MLTLICAITSYKFEKMDSGGAPFFAFLTFVALICDTIIVVDILDKF